MGYTPDDVLAMFRALDELCDLRDRFAEFVDVAHTMTPIEVDAQLTVFGAEMNDIVARGTDGTHGVDQ